MMSTPKIKYQVLNPRGIPAQTAQGGRIPIISFARGGVVTSWYEGDVFEPPAGFDTDGRLLREGFIAEVPSVAPSVVEGEVPNG